MTNHSHDERPDPESLLDRYQLRDIHIATDPAGTDHSVPRRGRLRIYLGMAPGVGKTFAMLNEGRRRKMRGTDVVIGLVETHSRPVTEEQIGDLEIIPRQIITYRDIQLSEMDVDAILARRPKVVLVDEMAHTNAPGSRNTKRYQDIQDLLAAGINVITTLNIQHLESLNDIVESITGVRQHETIPDQVLESADEVELVDISPEALRSRMRHGNVYPPDRARVALEEFFTTGNLTALRDLALRRTAQKTEDQLEVLMRPGGGSVLHAWGARSTERVLVAFDARPAAQHILRVGWRLANGLKAPFIAVTVLPPGQTVTIALQNQIRLAEDLGAEVLLLRESDVPTALAHLARTRQITQLVIGQPARSRWQEIRNGSIVNRLLRLPIEADVHIVHRVLEVEESS